MDGGAEMNFTTYG